MAVVVMAGVGAVFAVLGGASPTGITVVDIVYVGGAGAALAFAGGRARRFSWLASGLLALWFTPTTVGRLASIAALLLAVYAVQQGRRRVFGAAIGAILAFVLGDLGDGAFLGATVLYAAVAALPIVVSGARLMPSHLRRPVALAGSIAAGAAMLASLLFGLSALFAIGNIGDGIDSANNGFDLVSNGDQAGATRAFEASSSSFDSARSKVSGFWTLPARLVPLVGQHARAVQVVTSEGVALTDIAAQAAQSVDPDDVRLIDGRVDLGLIEDLQPVLERTERALDRAIDRVGDARSQWLVAPVDERFDELLTELTEAKPAAHTAAVAVRELPTFLGADGPTNWLIAITTPAEARGLGGLLGNWALVQADEGRITILQSGRNEDINAALRTRDVELSGPAQYLERWGRFEPNRFFQDVTLSPDLPMVAEVAANLFTAATDQPVDGVIVVDPYAVAAILRLSGPVSTDEITLNHRSVVPFLLEDQYIQYEDDENGRVRALRQLVEGAFAALTAGELPGPNAVADILGPVVEQDRIGIWWADGGGGDELVAVAGLDSRFPRTSGDLVALVHQNAGQNKLDAHLRRELDYRLRVDDGRAEGTVTVTLHNDIADLSLPSSIVGNNDQGYALGTNVVRLTVHTALGFQSARLDGEEIVIERQIAFGHDAITALIEVPPGSSRILEIDVGGELPSGPYSLNLPHQPLVNDDTVHLEVTIDGLAVDLPETFALRSDAVLSGSTG